MAVYVKVVKPPVEKTAAEEVSIERVHSPDNATNFNHEDALFSRTKAFEQWHNFDWKIENLPDNRYRVTASTP